MKKIFTAAIFLNSIFMFSQINALTDEGKEVVLFENGTWKYQNDSDASVLETITTNSEKFEKPKDASFLFKSKRLDVGLYINPKKWKIETQTSSPLIEYYFRDQDIENPLMGFTLVEMVEIPTLQNLKEVIVKTVSKRAQYFRLKKSEYRTVNGNKVLFLNYKANISGIDFEYIGNYLIQGDGYCSVVTFTTQKNFEKNQARMEEFINGLVKTEKATVSTELTPPPPPMK